MDRTLHIVGKNSGEIFLMKYPRSLLIFCDYDLTYFAENAIAVCDEGLKAGELDFDRVTELRNSLKSAHIYIEHNIRTTYDKIVLDCWIDYVCRRDNVGTGSLWNRFMPCNNAFEKAVFMRLCEYRYNRAINEWLNLVRVQDYAKSKMNFIFSADLNSAAEAASRRNYFDLMFSVTARELGCRIEDLGVIKTFSVGRVPSSPFIYSNISKDVVKNLLSDFDYSEDYSDTENYGGAADQIAMDAFSYMKSGLQNEFSSYNISRSEMENAPTRVYMPVGLKAVVDLEIDALIDSGGWLSRCRRCGRYFVRDEKHREQYCSLFNPGGKTCLQIYEMEHPKSNITPELQRSFREITDEMYARVDSSMSLEEYESWKVYLDALYGKVDKGEIPPDELEAFIIYSRSLDISRSNPVTEVPKREPEAAPVRERVVKPFIPERIDRSELYAQQPQKPVQEEEPDEYEPQRKSKGFFTSPTVQRQRSMESAPMTRLIRAEQSAEVLSRGSTQGGFTPFGQTEPIRPQRTERTERTQQSYSRPHDSGDIYRGEEFTPHGDFSRAPERREQAPQRPQYSPEPDVTAESAPQGFRPFGAQEFSAPDFSKQESRQPATEQDFDFSRIGEKLKELQELERQEERRAAPATPTAPAAPTAPEPDESSFDLFGDIKYDAGDSLESYGNVFDLERDGVQEAAAPVEQVQPVQQLQREERDEPSAQQRPKVIRKNAAAISAYGKISGAPVVTAAPQRKEPSAPQLTAPAADHQPFRDVGDIFDVLEKSDLNDLGNSNNLNNSNDLNSSNDMSNSGSSGAAQQDDSYFVFDRKTEPEKPVKPVEKPVMQTAAEPDDDVREYVPREEVREYVPRKKQSVSSPSFASSAPAEPPVERSVPEKVTTDNAPSGIWTEERNLFPDRPSEEELEMLKEKKKAKSNKTQRLFDAIMREPEDNPNMRRRK